ncbi:hypothetical protein BDD12DRAFT_808191 [Trichophaea hybrida]|nr:hypothetical protein BDD12DRAFT_808191 [Trichophaea hybrida]
MKANGDEKNKMIATLQQKLRDKDVNEIRKEMKVALKAIADMARILREIGERPPRTDNTSAHLEIIGEPPEKFDGDPKKYRTWAAAVTFYVGNQLEAFRSAQQVRIQIASLLTGTAWEKAQIDMPNIVSPLSSDMAAKEEALRVVMEWLAKLYQNRQEQLDAENKFAKLFQNDTPFQMFLIQFEHLYRIAQYIETSEKITGMIARHELFRAPTYEAVIAECYEVDGLTNPGTKYTHKTVQQLEEAKKYSQTQLERLKEKVKGKDCKFGDNCRREKEKPGSCFWKHYGAPRLAAGCGEVLRSTLRGGEDGKVGLTEKLDQQTGKVEGKRVRMAANMEGEAYHIDIDGVEVLIDCGATISICTKRTVRKLKLPTRPQQTNIKTVSGEIIKSRGIAEWSFYLDGHTMTQEMVIMENEEEAIFGMDWLKDYGISVSFKNDTISVGRKSHRKML